MCLQHIASSGLNPDSLQLVRRVAGQALPSLWSLRLCEPHEMLAALQDWGLTSASQFSSDLGPELTPHQDTAMALGVHVHVKAVAKMWHLHMVTSPKAQPRLSVQEEPVRGMCLHNLV